MTTSSKPHADTHSGWHLLSRVLAAILGGYVLTSAAIICLAALLPLPRAESVLAASLLGFAIFTAVIIWVFATDSLKKIWLALVISSAVMTGTGMVLARMAQ